MKTVAICLPFLTVLVFGRMSCRRETSIPVPDSSRQLILVISDSADAAFGTLARFQRGHAGQPWKSIGTQITVSMGKNGIAWGRGLHREQSDAVKQEGDGRSPAGVFRLGPLFGLDKPEPAGQQKLRMPFLPVTAALECVDDAGSRYYNQLIDRDTIAVRDWESSEQMASYTEAYRLGIVVQHNTRPVKDRAGSCIFLHVWSSYGAPTAGCTAMEYSDVRDLMIWLDASADPVLVQLPLPWYDNIRDTWHLPRLPAKKETP